MNIFDVKKRKTMAFDEWMKARKVAEAPKHMEKGEAAIAKDGMLGDVKGKEGFKNAMDDDNAGLDKKKHEATKATYSGPDKTNDGFKDNLSGKPDVIKTGNKDNK